MHQSRIPHTAGHLQGIVEFGILLIIKTIMWYLCLEQVTMKRDLGWLALHLVTPLNGPEMATVKDGHFRQIYDIMGYSIC